MMPFPSTSLQRVMEVIPDISFPVPKEVIVRLEIWTVSLLWLEAVNCSTGTLVEPDETVWLEGGAGPREI